MSIRRKQYVPEVLHQLEMVYRQPFYVAGRSLCTDFRTIRIEPLSKNPVPVLLLTGWGSGWEGIVPLAFHLACEGFRVILVSLPGYGDSEDPDPEFFRHDLYRNYAEVVFKVMRFLSFPSAYFVGHSMGAEILAEAAKMRPEACKKLVLLHPSGLKNVGFFGKFSLMWEFAASGARLRKEYYRSPESQDDYINELIDLCGQQKSPWWRRLRQRWTEFSQVCRGELLETLKEVMSPIVFISGSRDTVYDPADSLFLIQHELPGEYLEASIIIPGNHHNPTLFHAERTAAKIAEFLK